jgi:hypothetical protein
LLYLWFHLKAFWQPPKRGRVEASFDDMARGNGWSLKTLQRTIEELETIPFIEVERATNQYELTRIRIVKYDLEESTSALDKSVQSDTAGLDYAEVSGVDKFDCSTVHSKPASQQHQHDLQAPKKVKEVKELKNGTADAVRRPFDAKLPLSEQRGFSPSEKKKKLTARLAKAISANQDSYRTFIEYEISRGREHPFGDEERQAFSATGYKPDLNSPLLSFDFVMTVLDVYEQTRRKVILPGNLCSRIIDRCQSEKERNDGEGYHWPPDFQEHRDRLREQERLSDVSGRVEATA